MHNSGYKVVISLVYKKHPHAVHPPYYYSQTMGKGVSTFSKSKLLAITVKYKKHNNDHTYSYLKMIIPSIAKLFSLYISIYLYSHWRKPHIESAFYIQIYHRKV